MHRSNMVCTQLCCFCNSLTYLWKPPPFPITEYARTSLGRPAICLSLPALLLLVISGILLYGHSTMFPLFPISLPSIEWRILQAVSGPELLNKLWLASLYGLKSFSTHKQKLFHCIPIHTTQTQTTIWCITRLAFSNKGRMVQMLTRTSMPPPCISFNKVCR